MADFQASCFGLAPKPEAQLGEVLPLESQPSR
jgi:hypothetical protein